jgi:hypothetical protein
MNITSLENLKKEIDRVREYFKHIQYVDNLCAISQTEDEHTQVLLNIKI